MAKDNNKNFRWILIIIALIMVVSVMNKAPTQSVADIQGKSCTEDKDCPCWGEYTSLSGNYSAQGVGSATCGTDKKCDMTYCVDIKPVGEWLRDNPFNYLKENIMFTVVLLALILLAVFWPKV